LIFIWITFLDYYNQKPKDKKKGMKKMRFEICIVCKEERSTSNLKNGCCIDCLDKVNSGIQPYLDIFLKETNPIIEYIPTIRARRRF